MSNVVSMFPASGIEIAPAGYARLTLQWSTSDGNNLSVTFGITDGTNSYTVTSNANGYAEQLVASGGTYTISVTHDGTYLGDLARKVATESAKGYYIAWNAWVESGLQAIIIVTTDAGATVTATDQSTSTVYTATADSSGTATLEGMQAGHTYTVASAKSGSSHSTTITMEHIVAHVTVWALTRYTVKISRSTADDIERCVYADACEGWTPFARSSNTAFDPGSWDGNSLISGIKPINRSGSTVTDLDKKTLSGVSTSTAADAFVHIPTWYLSITSDDETITISFSDNQVDSTYVKYASLYNGSDRGYFDFGMFHSVVSSSNLYSYSGVTPTVSTSITNFIKYAQARGSGYDIINYDEVIYLSALFILLFKRTNFQAAIGRGYVDKTSSGAAKTTSAITTFANNYGMYGNTSSDTRTPNTVCFFWIHDFIGNVLDFVGGAKTNSSSQLMRIIGADSSVTESDFTLQSDTPTGNRSGYVSDVVATSTAVGFLPKTCSGAATTFWCDDGYVYSSNFPRWGGSWSGGAYAGPFAWAFNYSATETYSYIGSRLSYRAPS